MHNQNDIAQSIFDSISIIVENRLAGLEYDKTIICTIVDDSNAKNDFYTVTDGNIEFEANAQGNKYNINDSVRVEIPNGDWKQIKYIQGKHVVDSDLKPVTYVSPLDSILKLTDNLMSGVPSDYSQRSLEANQEPTSVKPTTIQIGNRINITDDIKNTDIFNSIYVRAEFQTDLGEYQMRSGDYGLLLVLSSVEGGKNQALKFSATQDMFGNPYAFKIYTPQEKVYELSSSTWSEGLSWIDVYLYEDNNFKYYDDNDHKVKYFDSEKIKNIKVQNIVVGFGSQIYKIQDNEVKIYTDNTDTFTVKEKNPDPSTVETKTFKLLWYNKTEDNEYVGFSDGKANDFANGKTYKDYDEIEYRKLIEKDTRLLNQKSDEYYDDELSLSIAADSFDINRFAKSSANIIQGELYRELRGLYNWTKNMFKKSGTDNGIKNDIDNNGTIINEMIENKDSTIFLSKLSQSLEASADKLSEYYLTALKNAKQKITTNNNLDSEILNLHNNVINPIITIFTLFGYNYDSEDGTLNLNEITDGSNVFPSLYNLIKTQYISYEDVYNSYKTRIDRLLNTICKYYKEINTLLDGNDTQLKSLLKGTSGEGYYKPGVSYESNEDTEEYNNRYCIYWYRQNLTHTDPDNILPPGWERMTDQNNKCLPDKASNGEYLEARAGAAVIPCKVDFNRYVQKEKIKAVLFYNHEQFESNELEFSNTVNVVDIPEIDKNGALQIEHWSSIDGKDSHSKDSYQLYDANGLLINAAEIQKKRELRVRFDGETGTDEQLIGATVYWYVPSNATLLDIFDSEVQDFYTDRVKEYSSLTLFKNTCKRDLISNYASYLVKVNVGEDNNDNLPVEIDWRTYVVSSEFNNYEKNYLFINQLQGDNSADKTKKYLVQDETNPLIYNEYEHDESVEGKWKATGITINRFIITSCGKNKPDNIEAQFANSSIYKPGYNCYYKTIGAKNKNKPEDADDVKVEDTIFTYHIKDYYNQTFTQNTIFCQVIKDDITYHADKTFTFSSFGNNGTDYTLMLLPDPQQNVITTYNPLDINVALYDYNNNKIDISANQFKMNDENEENNTVRWYGPSGYTIDAPLVDGDNITGITISKNTSAGNNCYAGILECVLKNIEIEQLNNKKINLTSYLPIAYSDSLNSYIEGTTMVIYDSLGTNPYYYKTPYKLFNALQNTEITNISWSIEYYDSKGTPVRFNNKTSKFTKTSLVSLTSENILSVPLMYIPQEIYPVVIAKNKSGVVLWAQPIIITQNRYASPMINDWDGRLEIDEEDNTIMTMMVGAGRKNSDNQFEGVLMGDVRTSTSDDATAIGLYGFHQGAQSFGFKIDGTAFLGKASGGRIEFDGTNSTITSAAYKNNKAGLYIDLDSSPYLIVQGSQQELLYLSDTNYYLKSNNYTLNSAGMKIDLTQGLIESYNFKLKSKKFELNNTPFDYTIGIGTNQIILGEKATNDFDIDAGGVIFGANNNFAITENGYIYANAGKIGPITIGDIASQKKVDDDMTSINNNLNNKVNLKEDGINFSWQFLPEDGFYMYDGSFNNENSIEVFKIYKNEEAEKYEAWLSGTIYANAGTIGAWNIYSSGILGAESVDNTNKTYGIGLDPRAQTITDNKKLFAIGLMPNGLENDEWNSTAFWVDAKGKVHCSDLEATGGQFGVWSIGSDAGLSEYLSNEASIYINSYRKPSAFYGTENQGSSIGVYLSSKGIHVKPLWLLDTDYADDWASWSAVVRVAGSFCKACQLYTGEYFDYHNFDYSFYDMNDIMNTTDVGHFAPTGWITYMTNSKLFGNTYESLLFVNGILASIYKGEVSEKMTNSYYLGYTWMADAHPFPY